MTKRTVIRRIYKAISGITSKIYSDDSWLATSQIQDAIQAVTGETVYMWADCGGYRSNPGGGSRKEYNISTTTAEGITVKGIVTCSQAGSVERPWDRYDVCVTLF